MRIKASHLKKVLKFLEEHKVDESLEIYTHLTGVGALISVQGKINNNIFDITILNENSEELPTISITNKKEL